MSEYTFLIKISHILIIDYHWLDVIQ